MNRLVVALVAGALVLAFGGFAAVTLAGRGGEPEPAVTDGGPAALPGEPSDAATAAPDPFDFDASALDPEYVWEDADIHLTCGQLLGEAQIATFLQGRIEHSELTAGERLSGGYRIVCGFWSDIVNIQWVQLEFISAGETIAFCFEGDNDAFYTADPAGPGDSFYEDNGGTALFYRTCLPNARLDIEVFSDVAAGNSKPTIADVRALAAYFAANRAKFDAAAATL